MQALFLEPLTQIQILCITDGMACGLVLYQQLFPFCYALFDIIVTDSDDKPHTLQNYSVKLTF
jgi:hypothetical protein